MSYNVLDSNGVLWAVTVNTDGTLTTTPTVGSVSTPAIISDGSQNWILGVATDGALTITQTAQPVTAALKLVDPNGVTWQIGISGGAITVTSQGVVIVTPGGCVVPLPANISESQFGTGVLVIHTATGHPVTVMADFSCYVCALSKFVLPEDTNMLLILDE